MSDSSEVTFGDQKQRDDELGPEDSASQASHGSRSHTSSSSDRVKAAAVAAGVAAAAKRLSELHAIEIEELAIQHRKRALELDVQLAKANAERDVYDQMEATSAASRAASRKSSVAMAIDRLTTADTTEPARVLEENAPDVNFTLERDATSHRPTVKDDIQRQGETLLDLLYRGQQQQQTLMNTMCLPKVELLHFDGDPLKYWLFSRQLDSNVDNNNVSECHKLLMLFQSCRGKARMAIECCAAMETAVGYSKARAILKERFGNNFVISEAWVAKVAGGPTIGGRDKEALQNMADDLRNCVENLDAMGLLCEVSTQSVLLKIVQRLPMFLRNRWVHEVMKIRKRNLTNPTIRQLMTFMDDAAAESNDPVYGHLNDERITGRRVDEARHGRGAAFNVSVNEIHQQRPDYSGSSCSLCGEQHSLFGCQRFKGMSTDRRRSYAMEAELCFNCLKTGHAARQCYLRRVCSVEGCGRKHTKFLHPVETEQTETSNEMPTNQAHAMCNATGNSKFGRISLPTIAVKARASPSDDYVVVHALLDSGSTNSFVTEDLVRKLKLRGTKQNLTLTTLDRQDRQIQTTAVNLEIAALDTSTFVTLDNVYTRKDIPIKEVNMGTAQDINKWPHLRDISIPAVDAKNVMLLIGQDNPDILLPREVRNGNRGEPYATRSLLGWTINGPLGLEYDKCRRHVTSNFVTMDDTLQKQAETFWKVDDWEAILDEKPSMSIEDRQAIDIWQKSIQKKADHYVLDIPFRSQPPDLPVNRDIAETRLHGLKKRLLRDSELCETYTEKMQYLIDKEHAEPVVKDTKPEGATWYLPHHPVFHPKKPGKMRIVFDCAARKNGTSLNDRVLQGPDLTNSLLGVLLRFRQEPIAIMADIEAMFHQVYVTPRNRDALRFLWWPNGDMERDAQELVAVSSSPRSIPWRRRIG